MQRIALIFVTGVLTMVFWAGCGAKSEEEYEKPALYWYQKMMKKIASGNLEKADNIFTSLESEHISSPLIPQAMLILMQAHIDNEEYLLANFYLEEYMKRYGSFKNRELAEFIQIKAAFYGLHSPQRDQKLISDTLIRARNYIVTYPKGEFTPMVHTMEVRLEMTRFLLNEKIARLYDRRDKPKAAAIYRKRNEASWIKADDIEPPSGGWFGWLFE
ncbi:outer membrane protein assembly factor BamD [Hydrogenimonas urashimensis]|uniref:outer membrane protein assembly factor BamD n=1 Tax=Hydrogenimonas urashimensis TaxID=2740515 RepID=UPI00191642FD|nr:outer membrane protein assembly factor BamD [Hydrogenimonas urashimensis]